jgi:hypothetical protein
MLVYYKIQEQKRSIDQLLKEIDKNALYKFTI